MDPISNSSGQIYREENTSEETGRRDLKRVRDEAFSEVERDSKRLANPEVQFASKELLKDRDFILEAVKKNYSVLQLDGERFRYDRYFMTEVAKIPKTNSDLHHFLTMLLTDEKNNPGILLEIIKVFPRLLAYPKLNRALVLEAMKLNIEFPNTVLIQVIRNFKMDKEMILEVVRHDFAALKFVSEELLNDKDFIIGAMKLTPLNQNDWDPDLIGQNLRNDREVMLEVMKVKSWHSLKLLSEEISTDSEFILQAIEFYDAAIQCASKDLLSDGKFLIEALKRNPYIIYQDPIKDMCNSQEFILGVLKCEVSSGKRLLPVNFALAPTLSDDRDFITEAVKLYIQLLTLETNKIYEVNDEVLKAVERYPEILKFVNPTCLDDIDFAKMAVKLNPSALKYVNSRFKSDKDFLLEVVKDQPGAIEFAEITIRESGEFLLIAAKCNPNVLYYICDDLFEDRDFILKAVQLREDLFFGNGCYDDDKEVILTGVKSFGSYLRYANYQLSNDKEVVLEAVQNDGRAWQHASKSLRKDDEIMAATHTSLVRQVKEDMSVVDYLHSFLGMTERFNLVEVLSDAWNSLTKDKDLFLASIIDHKPAHTFSCDERRYNDFEKLHKDVIGRIAQNKCYKIAHKISDLNFKFK